MNIRTISIVDLPAASATSADATVATRLDSLGLSRNSITITNRGTLPLFVRRVSTVVVDGIPTVPSPPTNLQVRSNWTYEIPPDTTLDLPDSGYIAIYASVASGTAAVGVQEGQ